MKDWTGIEIEAAKKGLERSSAAILGQMLFEFSRLDVALGLILVWSEKGRHLERLTKTISVYSFHKKLDYLTELVDEEYSDNPDAHSQYKQWLTDAHETRQLRNELVHGRWGTDPINQQVLNIVGLPTSPSQQEVRYTLLELEHVLEQMKELQVRQHMLREKWPV